MLNFQCKLTVIKNIYDKIMIDFNDKIMIDFVFRCTNLCMMAKFDDYEKMSPEIKMKKKQNRIPGTTVLSCRFCFSFIAHVSAT